MQLFPKNPKFFEIYNELVSTVTDISLLLTKISFSKNVLVSAKKARLLETRADLLFHKLQFEADSTFITPFDREDMHALGKSLNNILDLIENVIADLEVYNVRQNGNGFGIITRKIHQATGEIAKIVGLLKYGGKYPVQMKKHIAKIHEIENDGDQLVRDALSSLFRQHKKEVVELMKWSYVYQNLDLVFDECELTADIVNEIIIKNY